MPEDKIQWHPGYEGGIEFRLRKYKSVLEYHHEHPLSKKAIVVDTLVIEKKDDVVIDEDIAAIFLRHNIFEYKNPTDALSIDEYYNLLAYMCRYKATTGLTDAVKATQVTGTLIKDGKPAKAFKEIQALGGVVEKRYPGIYYISGLIHMPTQIIVQSELGREKNAVLRIISKHAREEDVRQFIEQTRRLSDADDKRNADAVYEVSMRANRELYERLGRDPEMCTAFKELFKDEILEAERNGELRGELRGERRGELRGQRQGQEKMGALIAKLLQAGRTEDALRASTDEDFRERLFAEYQMV